MKYRSRCSIPSLRLVLIATTLIVACGRARTNGRDSSVVVRDSMGITIVENGTSPVETWRLSSAPVITVGSAGLVEESPLDPTAVFFGPGGRIIVGDGHQVGWHSVMVYDAAGNFLSKMGGSGRGPGEFGGQLWWAGPYRGDSIVAWDRRGPSGPSIKVFGPDGGFSRDVTIPRLPRQGPDETLGFAIGFHGAFSDGSFLTSAEGVVEVPSEAGPAWYTHLLLKVNPEGTTWDTIGDFRFSQTYWDGSRQDQYLYGAYVYEGSYGDEMIRGNPQTYEYQILNPEGTPRLIVRRAHEPQPVGSADVEAVVAFFLESAARRRNLTPQDSNQMRRSVEAYAYPPSKPAYSSILVDQQQNVWVERFRWFVPWTLPKNPQPAMWDVFSPNGDRIAEMEVPMGVLLLSVSDDRVLGVRIDEDDVRHVEVFRLQRRGI